jgi:hypothetical protein
MNTEGIANPWNTVAFAQEMQLAARPRYSRDTGISRDILSGNDDGWRAFSACRIFE